LRGPVKTSGVDTVRIGGGKSGGGESEIGEMLGGGEGYLQGRGNRQN